MKKNTKEKKLLNISKKYLKTKPKKTPKYLSGTITALNNNSSTYVDSKTDRFFAWMNKEINKLTGKRV
tara:strand:+ start:6993 stop:7196 length:204 start_codon:yes stop_codon:yes gene_type:complete